MVILELYVDSEYASKTTDRRSVFWGSCDVRWCFCVVLLQDTEERYDAPYESGVCLDG